MKNTAIPRTSRDVFNQAAEGLKDRFLATARLTRCAGHYVFDIENCPAVAVNDKVIEDIADPKPLTRQQMIAMNIKDSRDVHGLVAGVYLWMAGRLVTLQRTGGALASGFFTNPSGVCDDLPTNVMHDEMVEESPLAYKRGDTLVVPVLCREDDKAAGIARKVAIKEGQAETFARQADAQGIKVSRIVCEPLAVRERLEDHALHNVAPIEIRHGGDLCDAFTSHVHWTPQYNAWNFHKTYDVTMPPGADVVLMDGEGFDRPGFLLTPQELHDRRRNVLGFFADYVATVRNAPQP